MAHIRLGAEFPAALGFLSQQGWASFKTLKPEMAKFRLTCSPIDDVLEAISIMKLYTPNPWVLFRPSGEVPKLFDLWIELAPIYSQIWNLGCTILVEPMNEPNHPGTAPLLGETLEDQLFTYRSKLITYQQLHDGFNVKLIAPGLRPNTDHAWEVSERGLFNYDGIHLYGDGSMLPDGFKAPPICTEIGRTQGDISNTIELLNVGYSYGVTDFTFFILGYEGIAEEFKQYILTPQDAYMYQQWAKSKEDIVPVDQIREWLIDMWRRQGANPNTESDPFFQYALLVAKTQGRAIVPMLSTDGNYLNYSDPTRVVSYTIPPMWALKSGGPVQEGLPPNL